ncbi:MAG: glycosyltransferase family 4 protein [Planctomycetota bacterium]
MGGAMMAEERGPLKVVFAEAGSGAGGSAMSLLRILRVLREEHAALIEPTVVTLSTRAARRFQEAGLPWFSLTSQRFWGRFRQMRAILKETGAELVHCNNPPYDHIPLVFAARSRGLPVTLHFRVSRALSMGERLTLRFVRHVFAVSEEGASVLRKQTALPPGRVTFLGEGVFLGEYTRAALTRGPMRERLGLARGDFAVLLPATLQPGKGQDTVIAAALIEAQATPRAGGQASDPPATGRIVWLLAGGEHYQAQGFAKKLMAILRERKLEARVRLLGHRRDMPELLAACDVVALPSELAEGTPCAVIEAFAAGRPVATTRVGGLGGMVDGTVGVLIEPRDARALAEAVVLLRDDPVLRAHLGANALRRAEENHDIRRVVMELVQTLLAVARPKTE